MKKKLMPFMLIAAVVLPCSTPAQQAKALADNAALRYWSAFSDMQDTGVTVQQAKELNAVLDGTVPYDDAQYKALVEKNTPALRLMARGTSLPQCDWGLDYAFGEETPVEYAREGLALGRLNVLYALHLAKTENVEGAVSALSAGLRFSKDVANGGTLFATLAAASLISNHLRAIEFVLHVEGLTQAQRSALQQAVVRLGSDGVDWRSAIKQEMQVLRPRFANDPQAAASLTRIAAAYVEAVNGSLPLEPLNLVIHEAPSQVAQLIPRPERIVEQKQNLTGQLARTRSLLQ